MSSTPSVSGTREWSVASVNCILGCPHRCRYCYAKARAVRLGQCPSHDAWGTTYHHVRVSEVRKKQRKVDGRVMFPTTHDITPEHLGPCMEVIENILRVGNDLLIVSKPHLGCIKSICRRFEPLYREAILFRFSIGSTRDDRLSYWEPGAPAFAERLSSLRYAFEHGFATSVSSEPLMDADDARKLFDSVEPYVTDTVWIGCMNRIGERACPGTDPKEIDRIRSGQTPEAIRRVYDELKAEPKIRWKESYKEVLGLQLAECAGLDV